MTTPKKRQGMIDLSDLSNANDPFEGWIRAAHSKRFAHTIEIEALSKLVGKTDHVELFLDIEDAQLLVSELLIALHSAEQRVWAERGES